MAILGLGGSPGVLGFGWLTTILHSIMLPNLSYTILLRVFQVLEPPKLLLESIFMFLRPNSYRGTNCSSSGVLRGLRGILFA